MIMCAAIRFYAANRQGSYPYIFTGKRHNEIFAEMANRGIVYNKNTCCQGFMTDDNRFLDRYDAKIEARRCRQLIHDTEDRALYSEDIWPV